MPPENPLISVVIPAYNAADFLPEAIASVRAQRYAPLEIIVVDDGSTDNTAALAHSWPDVRIIHQKNQGPSAARNAGIAAARSDLIAMLDADDFWTPNHLQVLLAPLQADPQLTFAWGQSRVVRRQENADGSRSDEVLHESVPQFLIGSGLYRRSAFAAVGPFDPKLRLAEDIDWILTARQRNVPHAQLTDTVLVYRKREGSLTSGKDFQQLNVMAALQRSIQRHRAGSRPAARVPRQGTGSNTSLAVPGLLDNARSKPPSVSVVIPAYNAAPFLVEAIRSIERQEYPNSEVIVVDDGSTDNTAEIAAGFADVRCIRQPNCGIAAARNAGVVAASGTLLAFLDADDLWADGKLAAQIDVLQSRPDIHVVAGRVEQFCEPSCDRSAAAIPDAGEAYTAGAMLIRRNDFLRVGLFDPALRVGEFVDWHSRAMSAGLVEHRLETVVLRRRIHGGNTTLRRQDSVGDYLSVLKAHLDRKRQAA